MSDRWGVASTDLVTRRPGGLIAVWTPPRGSPPPTRALGFHAPGPFQGERESMESRGWGRERERKPNRATECKWGEVRDSRLKLYIGEREEEQSRHQGCMCVLENEEDSS